jgi:hypothetical protein
MKLLGSLIVLSLAAGCALPANENAHKQSSAQNGANDPNGNPGDQLSPPDDDPNNEEGPGDPNDQTCHSTASVPDGWTVYDGGAYTVALPPGAVHEPSTTSPIWDVPDVGPIEIFVRDDLKTVDEAEAFNKMFFASGKNGPRPCQVDYTKGTLDCHDALTMKGACYYGEVTQKIDWVDVLADGKLYFLSCGLTVGKGDDVCAKFFASFHLKK